MSFLFVPRWKLTEIYYLSTALLTTFFTFFFEDFVPGFRRRQLTYHDIIKPDTLSELIQKDVVLVANREEKLSLGAGGTGTDRFAVVATLRDGSKLSLFVKIPATSMFERIFLTVFKVYQNELNFYENIRPLLPDNDTVHSDVSRWCPEVYCAKRIGHGKFVLVLEDISTRREGCECQYVLDTYTDSRARACLLQLSKLHAYFWDRPPAGIWSYSAGTGLSEGPQTPPMLRLVAEESLKNVVRRYASSVIIPSEILDLIGLLLENYSAVRKFWSTGVLTLCHGDAHVGNMFFSKTTGQMGFLDMQCVSADHCMRDVAYHLINSCDSETLGINEKAWLNYYLEQLSRNLKDYRGLPMSHEISFEDAYFVYRTQASYCLLAWIICCGASDLVLPETATPALQRMIKACLRLHVLEAIQQVIDTSKQKQL